MEDEPPRTDDLLAPILELLQVLRAACGGDLDKNIILMAVALRTVGETEFDRMSERERLEGEVKVFPSLGVNARSIADSSGIPRETVRRKVAELVEAGWLFRQGRNLHFTQHAYQALSPARQALETLAQSYHAVIARRLAPGRARP